MRRALPQSTDQDTGEPLECGNTVERNIAPENLYGLAAQNLGLAARQLVDPRAFDTVKWNGGVHGSNSSKSSED